MYFLIIRFKMVSCILKLERREKCMVDWLEQLLGNEWDISPAGGLTGDAYFAENNNERLFLKRNSSPFLAVLSAEGIVPKLIWTKRMKNGDVITAQEWLDGRHLQPSEMQHEEIARMLHKIHQSSELLYMLMRLGKRPVTSDDNFRQIEEQLSQSRFTYGNDEISSAFLNLKRLLPATRGQKLVVCHCDLNHNNLIMTNDDQLFLVDWDNAMIADPVMDFGLLLKWYIPQSDWDTWLKRYGVTKDNQLVKRMYWYLLVDSIQYFIWHNKRNEHNKARERINNIRKFNNYIETSWFR